MTEQVSIEFLAVSNMSSLIEGIQAANAQVAMLNKNMVGLGAAGVKSLAQYNSEFAKAMTASGQFTSSLVSMQHQTEKFGRSLQDGKLTLSQYRQTAVEAYRGIGQAAALAERQVRHQNAIVQSLGKNAQGSLQAQVFVPTG